MWTLSFQIDMSFPKSGSWTKILVYLVSFPIMFPLYVTLPDTRNPDSKFKKQHYFPSKRVFLFSTEMHFHHIFLYYFRTQIFHHDISWKHHLDCRILILNGLVGNSHWRYNWNTITGKNINQTLSNFKSHQQPLL